MSKERQDLTRSNDPKMVAARVFIGRLPTERIEKKDIEDVFAKHGKILGVSLFKGFGFVQYEREKEAQAAVTAEGGSLFHGSNIDCKIASERKKPTETMGHNNGIGVKRVFPFEVDDGPHARRHNLDDVRMDYGRQFPPERIEPFPAPAIRGRDAGIDRPFDCVIIVCQKSSKSYAEHIERRLLELNLTIDMIFLIHEGALEKAVDDMAKRGVLYIIVVMPQHEQHRSITVSILHGVPQEHRNMPLDDALAMLARNFNNYVSSLRIGSEQPSMVFLLNILADGKHLSISELDRVIVHLQDRRDRLIESEGAKPPARIPPYQPPPQQTGLLAGAGQALGQFPMQQQQQQQQNIPMAANPQQDLQQKILSLIGGSSTLNQPQQSGPTNALSSLAQQYGINLNQGGAAGSGILGKAGLISTAGQPALNTLGGGGGLDSLGAALGAVGGLSNLDPSLRKALDSLVSNPSILRNLSTSQAQPLSSMAGAGGAGNVVNSMLQQPQAAAGAQAQFGKPQQPQQQQQPSILGSLNSFLAQQQQQQQQQQQAPQAQMPPTSQHMGGYGAPGNMPGNPTYGGGMPGMPKPQQGPPAPLQQQQYGAPPPPMNPPQQQSYLGQAGQGFPGAPQFQQPQQQQQMGYGNPQGAPPVRRY